MSLKIKATPRYVEELNLDDPQFEGLYWIGNNIILSGGYKTILVKKSTEGGIYRKLEVQQQLSDPNVVCISTYSPDDFGVRVEYFEPVELEP
jgi:hypothetical protein